MRTNIIDITGHRIPNERERCNKIRERFNTLVGRRKKIDIETRKQLLEQLLYDYMLFVRRVIDQHGSTAFPVIAEFIDYLDQRDEGLAEVLNRIFPEWKNKPEIKKLYVVQLTQQAENYADLCRDQLHVSAG